MKAKLHVHRIFIHVGPHWYKRESDFSGFPRCTPTVAALSVSPSVKPPILLFAHGSVLPSCVRHGNSWSPTYLPNKIPAKLIYHQTISNSHVSFYALAPFYLESIHTMQSSSRLFANFPIATSPRAFRIITIFGILSSKECSNQCKNMWKIILERKETVDNTQ